MGSSPQIISVSRRNPDALSRDQLTSQQVSTFWAEAAPRVRGFVIEDGTPRSKCSVSFSVCTKKEQISLTLTPLKPDLLYGYVSERFNIAPRKSQNTVKNEEAWQKLESYCQSEIQQAWRCLLDLKMMEAIRINITIRELVPMGHYWELTGPPRERWL